MRTAASWIVGFVVFLSVGLGLAFLGDAVGVPIAIDLDEPTTITHGGGRYSYDEEVSSLQTSYGSASGVFAIAIGLWAGQAVFFRSWGAGFTKKGWYSFIAWLMAAAILMLVSVLVHLAFRSFHGSIASYLRMFIELGALLGVGWSCYQWFNNRIKHLERETRP